MLAAGHAASFDLFNLCVWVKNNGGMGSLYRSRHELVFVFRNGKQQLSLFEPEIRLADPLRRDFGSVSGANSRMVGIDTLTTITCQYCWLAHSRSLQNQSLAIVAANPKRLRERLYWVNVSMPGAILCRKPLRRNASSERHSPQFHNSQD
jgi:hypothetical protein